MTIWGLIVVLIDSAENLFGRVDLDVKVEVGSQLIDLKSVTPMEGKPNVLVIQLDTP